MTLTLICKSCVVCDRDVGLVRDKVRALDDVDEEGRRIAGSWWDYRIPPARQRDRIAPGLCDECWIEHAQDMNSPNRRWGRSTWPPPFRSIYLWYWVGRQLEKQARRLSPHYAAKAQRGLRALVG